MGLHLAPARDVGAFALGGRRPGGHPELRRRVDAGPTLAAGEAGDLGARDGDLGKGEAQEAHPPERERERGREGEREGERVREKNQGVLFICSSLLHDGEWTDFSGGSQVLLNLELPN